MSLHVVVQMKRGQKETWEIHVPDAADADEATEVAEGMAEQNGGDWKVSTVEVVEPETTL